MKKIIFMSFVLCANFIIFPLALPIPQSHAATAINNAPCEDDALLSPSAAHASGFEPALQVSLQYPKQAKVQEDVPITALVTPRSFPMENPMSIKITCHGCPEAEYSIRKGFPTSRITFNKAGTYSLSISIGLLMSAG